MKGIKKKFKWWQAVLMAFLACLLTTIVTLVAAKLPLYYTDAEMETVGRITYYGWPLPCFVGAPGYSLVYGLREVWKLPLNWCFWLMPCLWLCGFRTKRSFFVSLLCILPLAFALLYLFASGYF